MGTCCGKSSLNEDHNMNIELEKDFITKSKSLIPNRYFKQFHIRSKFGFEIY